MFLFPCAEVVERIKVNTQRCLWLLESFIQAVSEDSLA